MFKDRIFKLKRRRYEKTFENWFTEGNRLLWVEDTLFVLMGVTETIQEHIPRIQIWACDRKRNYYKSGFLSTAVFGEMIAKKIVTERIRENMHPTTKETFMQYLNIYDEMATEINWGIRYVFSFDSIDSNKIPDWLVAELVEHKLSK